MAGYPQQHHMPLPEDNNQVKWRWYDWIGIIFILLVTLIVLVSIAEQIDSFGKHYSGAIGFSWYFTIVITLGYLYSRFRGFAPYTRENDRAQWRWYDWIVATFIFIESILIAEATAKHTESFGENYSYTVGIISFPIVMIILGWLYGCFRSFAPFIRDTNQTKWQWYDWIIAAFIFIESILIAVAAAKHTESLGANYSHTVGIISFPIVMIVLSWLYSRFRNFTLYTRDNDQISWQWYDYIIAAFIPTETILIFMTFTEQNSPSKETSSDPTLTVLNATGISLFFIVIVTLGWLHGWLRGFTTLTKQHKNNKDVEDRLQVQRQWWDYVAYVAIFFIVLTFVVLIGELVDAEEGSYTWLGWVLSIPIIVAMVVAIFSLCWGYNQLRGFEPISKQYYENQPNKQVPLETIMKDPSKRLKVSILYVAFAFLIIGLSLVEHQFPFSEDKDLPLWIYPLILVTTSAGIISIVNWIFKPPSERVQLPKNSTSFWLIPAIAGGSGFLNSILWSVFSNQGVPLWATIITLIGGYLGIAALIEVFYTRMIKDTNNSLDIAPSEAQTSATKSPSEKRIVSILLIVFSLFLIGLPLVDHQFDHLVDSEFGLNRDEHLPFWAYPLVLITAGVGIMIGVDKYYKPARELVQILPQTGFLSGLLDWIKPAINYFGTLLILVVLLTNGIPLWAVFITLFGGYIGIAALVQMLHARIVKNRRISLGIPPPPPPPEAGTSARTGLG